VRNPFGDTPGTLWLLLRVGAKTRRRSDPTEACRVGYGEAMQAVLVWILRRAHRAHPLELETFDPERQSIRKSLPLQSLVALTVLQTSGR